MTIMTNPTPRPSDGAGPELRRDASEVMHAVREAFTRVVRALPTPVSRPIQVSEALGLHRKLGWQIWKIIESADPYEASQYLPGPTGVRSFLDSAARLGVAPAIIKAAEDAAARIDQLVSVHAGDRATLEMMLGSLAGTGPRQVEELRRRDAYRGNTFIWGVQVRTLSYTTIINAGDGDTLDVALLHGLVDLRRVRPEASCVLAESLVCDAAPRGAGEPLAAANGMLPHPLIPEFCSSPLPSVRQSRGGDGRTRLDLDESPLGETGAVTCRMARLFRGVGSRRRKPGSATADFSAMVRKPGEVLVHDLLVHRDLFGPVEPDALVVSDLPVPLEGEPAGRSPERLPVTAAVQRLGGGAGATATRDIPGHADFLHWAFGRLGWDGDQFDAYRVRIKFPIVASRVVIRLDLPG